ncbi:F0F1 ATP synthase subunit delta [Faunimonas sp. B44]|uniref:F0F1 ATP synthase subunit delta n=1 Tax=Faunimonas sp. B44 TaxID=3461493 RepID=UPI0040449542
MTDRTSSVSGVAERYASALFDLAKDELRLISVESDLNKVRELLNESADLRRMVASPVFSAEEQERAIAAVLERAGIGGLVGNFVRLVAHNRRLFALPGILTAFQNLMARDRGEATAQVTSAQPLSEDQKNELKAVIRDRLGKTVTIEAKVDPAILGGLIVRVGSRMIDTSLRTKLMTMKTHLKEVG